MGALDLDQAVAEGGFCVPAGKRKVTIEEIREALRKACAEARERDPEGTEAAAASEDAAPPARQPAPGRRRQQRAPTAAKPKKATSARKAGRLDTGQLMPADSRGSPLLSIETCQVCGAEHALWQLIRGKRLSSLTRIPDSCMSA